MNAKDSIGFNDPAKQPPLYCRQCGYDLRGLPQPRCPECANPFDPANPHTFRRRPVGAWVRPVRRLLCVATIFLLILCVIWGCYYWGWHSEQQTLNSLGQRTSSYKSLISPEFRATLGAIGFVFDRVDSLFLTQETPIDLQPLVKFKHLRHVTVCETPVKDLSPLARLDKLEELRLIEASIKDISPLAGLKQIKILELDSTNVTDLSPLTGLSSLRKLTLPRDNISEAQVKVLQNALPKCAIVRN